MQHKARLILRRPDLTPVATIDDFYAFDCSRAENATGAFSCTMPMRDEYTGIEVDSAIEVQRSFDGGATWENDLRTIWFVRSLSIDQSEQGETLTLGGHDALGLLDRRLVAYFAVQNSELEQNYYSMKYQPADDAMREIVRENCTAAIQSVPADDLPGSVSVVGVQYKIIPGLTVEENTTRGPVVKAEIAWKTVSDALRTVATASEEEGVRCLFDLDFDAELRRMEFRVRRDLWGTDRTQEVVFSIANGNVSGLKMIRDHTQEVTWMHVGGDGQGDLRLFVAVKADPFAASIYYPIEGYVDSQDSKNEQSVMEQDGRHELNLRAARWVFSATALDTPWCRFGRHYFYGDRVMVRHRDVASVCRINKVRLTYTPDATVRVEVPLETEELI